jgi:pyruvate, water dikinase
MNRVEPGDVLVTDMTDPDWEPIMKRASAIVTNRGGRTCHAAIIARELGIPAVVGCGDATDTIKDGTDVTVSCAEGDTGYIYEGELDFERSEISLDSMPDMPLKIMMNVGNPDRAFDFASPHAGVGLARLEFIINRMIGVHPKALLEFRAQDENIQATIREIAGYANPVSSTSTAGGGHRHAGGGLLAGAGDRAHVGLQVQRIRQPGRWQPVRAGRGKPDAGLPGRLPLHLRGFPRLLRAGMPALKKVREEMGLTNVLGHDPLRAHGGRSAQVTELLAENGLKRGENGLKLIMMCELPSNALLADEFLEYFDGFSIGSNDLTQLTLGLDRDSGLIAHSSTSATKR